MVSQFKDQLLGLPPPLPSTSALLLMKTNTNKYSSSYNAGSNTAVDGSLDVSLDGYLEWNPEVE